jgi:hydrogenase maturation protease
LTGHTLILGYGNPLRGDDGVGWHAAEQLLERSVELHAKVTRCQQLMPELAEPVSRAERVIFIDARVGPTPGTVEVCEVAAGTSEYPTFSHCLDPATLAALAQELYGRAPEAWILTVTGESFGHTDRLSASVQSSLPELIRQVETLALRGMPALPVTNQTLDMRILHRVS